LAAEGIRDGVHWVGDVMLEMLRNELPRAEATSDVLDRLSLRPAQYLLVTIHRAANTDDPSRLASILETLGSLGETVIFPVHPRTRKAMNYMPVASTVRMIDPIGYGDMLVLTRNARLVLTDSGGVQKEAFFLGTACLTLRDETEWHETVVGGWNCLVGVSPYAIRAAAKPDRPQGNPDTTPFGNGQSAQKIVEAIERAGFKKP
jgi:UDP-N-acetylglucosamine 2-epimerase